MQTPVKNMHVFWKCLCKLGEIFRDNCFIHVIIMMTPRLIIENNEIEFLIQKIRMALDNVANHFDSI